MQVSATIHLANRDWAALVADFVNLGFLPDDADRGVIIPVMEKVLSPYLRGGGARAFNVQVYILDVRQVYTISSVCFIASIVLRKLLASYSALHYGFVPFAL